MTSEDPQSVIRDRRLTPEEAVRYRRIREQIESEKPEINARIRARLAELKELASVFEELRKAREEQSLSLGDIQERTGIDRSALSNLETGQRRLHAGDGAPLRRRGREARCVRADRQTRIGWDSPAHNALLSSPKELPRGMLPLTAP